MPRCLRGGLCSLVPVQFGPHSHLTQTNIGGSCTGRAAFLDTGAPPTYRAGGYSAWSRAEVVVDW